MLRHRSLIPGALACLLAVGAPAWAGDSDEFRPKRQDEFEFAEKPAVARDCDRVTITFASKGYCDVTVAIEDAQGRIVRHLASGVLGPNAPAPLTKNSLRQSIAWDGKDDRGRYVDDKAGCVVRVSLGLRPLFERTLYWSPHKRITAQCPLIRAAPDGVYVFEGEVVDSLRVFDHQGNYLRTAYPFPADKLATFNDLHWQTFPQDGARLPLKEGFHQSTLLSSGNNAGFKTVGVDEHNNHHGYVLGNAASTLAVRDGRIALAKLRLNRFATDGSSLGLPLLGPRTAVTARSIQLDHGRRPFEVSPWSSALSPDGKWLYLAGYAWRIRGHWDYPDGVARLRYDGDGTLEVFAGSLEPGDGGGGDGRFRGASSVACDDRGRVYVADFMNDRVQVFSPEGAHLKNIASPRPAVVRVHHRTGEIFVFSWIIHCRHFARHLADRRQPTELQPTVTRYGPFEDPCLIASHDLPLPAFRISDGKSYHEWPSSLPGPIYWAELDSWTDPPTVWLGRASVNRLQVSGGHLAGGQDLVFAQLAEGDDLFARYGIVLLSEQGGKLVATRRFGEDVASSVARAVPPKYSRQRLYVAPATGKLLVAEGDSGIVNKGFKELLEIDPETGEVRRIELPLTAEDLTIDLDGQFYLRGFNEIARFDSKTWREVPFDYGEERQKVSFGGGKTAPAQSALVLPTHVTLWHRPGFGVSPNGNIAVGSYGYAPSKEEAGGRELGARFSAESAAGRTWTPQLYPGRMVAKKATSIQVWDRHGKMLHEDAVRGLRVVDGVQIDRDDNLYVLLSEPRILDGQRYFNRATGTLIKFKPGEGRIVTAASGVPVPLPQESYPQRPGDAHFSLSGSEGTCWVEGAEWFYGGVGFAGMNAFGASGCCCWNMRFALDYFARSFVPETDHYSVAVLDGNGNLILRVGRYGNVDDGKPLEPAGGPARPRPVGDGGFGLTHACYVAAHTDRRLFIADAGNARIVSVKLGYHAEERVKLR